MVLFAAEFPVKTKNNYIEFIKCVMKWILESPHTRLKSDDIKDMLLTEECYIQNENEIIEMSIIEKLEKEMAAVRYKKIENSLEWISTITFSKEKGKNAWVSVRISCESKCLTVSLPKAKKPVILRVLLRQLGGGSDGILKIGNKAIVLKNTEIELASSLISGRIKYHLPIVYISSKYYGGYVIDGHKLADRLSGMAHVIIEPNRYFSERLRIEVQNVNVNGGAVGIYWPDSDGSRSSFSDHDYSSVVELEEAVYEEVRVALTNRLPLASCTWSSVQELCSIVKIEKLKLDGSQEIDEYINSFDKDLSAKQEKLNDAEKEILRLRAEVRKYEARTPLSAGVAIQVNREKDLYAGEIIGIVLDVLSDARKNINMDGRKYHVIDDILSSNLQCDEKGSIQDAIKNILKSYKSMDVRTRKGLEDIGFEITEDGKHYKLIFKGDDRYHFTLSKTAGDYRCGKNSASEIIKILF